MTLLIGYWHIIRKLDESLVLWQYLVSSTQQCSVTILGTYLVSWLASRSSRQQCGPGSSQNGITITILCVIYEIDLKYYCFKISLSFLFIIIYVHTFILSIFILFFLWYRETMQRYISHNNTKPVCKVTTRRCSAGAS